MSPDNRTSQQAAYWKSRAKALSRRPWPLALSARLSAGVPADADWSAWLSRLGDGQTRDSARALDEDAAPVAVESILDALLALGPPATTGLVDIHAAIRQMWAGKLEAQVGFLLATQRDGEAAALLDERAAAEVSDLDKCYVSAAAAMADGKGRLAEVASRRAVELAPEDASAQALRAEVLAFRGRRGLAAAHMVHAIESGGRDVAYTTNVVARCYPCFRSQVGFHEQMAKTLRMRQRGAEGVAAFARCIAEFREKTPLAVIEALGRLGGETDRAAIEARPMPPLVLISQIQRSGGTLLNQLFDGHPALLTHPHELKVGFPAKWDWPALDMTAEPLAWLSRLFERPIARFMRDGYAKADGNRFAQTSQPFTFDLPLFCETFLAAAEGARTQRRVIDAYMQAYFSAWGEGGARPEQGRWIVGFCPRLIQVPQSVAGFFDDYADGRMISCVRNPIGWFVSSARHAEEYRNLDTALPQWMDSVRAALKAHAQRPGAVRIVTYERLVEDPVDVMAGLARWLAIEPSPILSSPTYGGLPTRPNSSFDVATEGVHRLSLDRRDLLGEDDLRRIEAEAMPLYRMALAAASRPGGGA